VVALDPDASHLYAANEDSHAIVAHARVAGIDAPPAMRFASAPGMGAEADVEGVRVTVGNERLFEARKLRAWRAMLETR